MRKKYHGGEGVRCSLSYAGKKGGRSETTTTTDGDDGDDDDHDGDDGDGERKPGPVAGRASRSASSGMADWDDVTSASSSAVRLEYVFGDDGVVEVYDASDFRRTSNLVVVPSLSSFVSDYRRLVEMASSGAMRSFSFQRLQMLSSAFKMHVTINGAVEDEAQSELLGTDFYRTMKVDNHIHLAAAASARQFVNFVRDKLEDEGDTVVMEDGQTLREVFRRAGLDTDHLTIDAFSVLADYSTYQRFDNFNDKYSPFRLAQMRKIFLKTDNHIDGRCVNCARVDFFCSVVNSSLWSVDLILGRVHFQVFRRVDEEGPATPREGEGPLFRRRDAPVDLRHGKRRVGEALEVGTARLEGREHAILSQSLARAGATSVACVLPEGKGQFVPGHAGEPFLSPVRCNHAPGEASGGFGAAVEHRGVRQCRRRGRTGSAALVLPALVVDEGGQSCVQLANVLPVGQHRGFEQGEGIEGPQHILVPAACGRDWRSDAFGGDVHAEPVDKSRDQSG